MLVEDIVVESGISNCEACELSGVPVWVSAALNGSGDQSKVEEFLVEVTSVSAKITNQVANLGSDRGILVHDQVLQIGVDTCVMDVFVKIFGDSRKLRDKGQSIHNHDWIVLVAQQLILCDDTKTIRLDELLGKLLGALSAENESRYQSDSNWDGLRVQVF